MARYDEITEVRKHDSEAKTFEEILKFNPYHDAIGRFSSANGAHSFTRFTQSKAGQKAIANIKAKQQAAAGGGGGSTNNKDNMSVQDKITDLFSGGALSGGGSTPHADKQGQKLLDELEEQMKPKKPSKPKKKPAKQDDQSQDIGNTKKQKDHPEGDYGLDSIFEEPTDKTYEKVAKELKVSKEKATEMVDGVSNYSDGFYDDLRAASRGEQADEGTQKMAQDVEDFIKASPKWAGGQLHRGIKIYDMNDYAKILKSVQDGKPIDMRGMSSWSSDKDVAESFASAGKRHVILITNEKSTSHGTSIKHLSKYPHEQEVLMSKDAVFTPTRMEQKGDYVYIYGDMP